MDYNNHHTDQQLQELEFQSLPDLSKMDEHWQQMKLLLLPAAGKTITGKNIVGKKFLLLFLGFVIILVISIIVYKNNRTVKDRPSFSISKSSSGNPDTVKATTITDSPDSGNRKDELLKKTATISAEPVNSKALLENFYLQLQKKPQRFLLSNLTDAIIYGKEGTRILIPAHSFNVTGNYFLLLTEFYSLTDMIAEKLTTTSNGRRLVTGGMVYLDARTIDDEIADLNKGAFLRLDIPKQDNQQLMGLFYGDDYYRNDITEVMDSINWRPTDHIFTTPKLSPFQSSKKDTAKKQDEPKRPRETDFTDGDGIGDTIRLGTESIPVDDPALARLFGVSITRLGWINCDRFYNDSRPKTELIVELDDNPDNYSTLLVFERFASIMRPSAQQGNILRFSNLPEGERARIVVLGIKDSKPVSSIQDITISNTPVNIVNFEAVTVTSFRKKLDQ